MVKISNGVHTFMVTKGAFNDVFKRQGFGIVEDAEAMHAVEHDDAGMGADGEDFTELEEKPISQWSKAEVKRYAAAKGIDISGTANVNEAKDRIKAAIG